MAHSTRTRLAALLAAGVITMTACGSSDANLQEQVDDPEAEVEAPTEEAEDTTTTVETTTSEPVAVETTTIVTAELSPADIEALAEMGIGFVTTGPNGGNYAITRASNEEGSTIVSLGGSGEWADVWQPEGEEYVRFAALESGPEALVVIGSMQPTNEYNALEERRPFIMTSVDGAAWTRAEIAGDFEGRGGVLTSIVWSESDSLYYALGWDGVGNQDQRTMLFSSADGSSWEPVDGPFDEEGLDEKGSSIHLTEGGLVALGTAEYAVEPFAILWAYDADSGWTRETIDINSRLFLFEAVDEYEACLDAALVDLSTQTLQEACPSTYAN